MEQESQSLKFNIQVNASDRAAYHAFSQARGLQEWLCNLAAVDSRKNGGLYLAWNSGYSVMGQFTRMEFPHKIAFTWQGFGEPSPSEVKVTFSPQEDHLDIDLIHVLNGSGKSGKKLVREIEKGWLIALENLKSVLETGQDLRLIRRPFSGVYPVPFKPEKDSQSALDIPHGLRLASVNDGGSAQAAGLRVNDVVTKLGGERMEEVADWMRVLDRFHAGDEVKVVFYRHGEKQTTQMTLGKRPVQNYPETMDDLLQKISSVQQEGYQGIASALAGVKDSEASSHPAPEEWNIKEVLAHLIISERDLQAWLCDLQAEQGFIDPVDHGNDQEWLAACVAAHGRARSLISELRRSQKETFARLKAVLPTLVERKGTFRRVSANAVAYATHVVEHIEQIKTCLDGARPKEPEVITTPMVDTSVEP